MLETHARLWAAIDLIAKDHGLSPSGLAKRSGLHPTALNKSKRFSRGEPHWPSTATVAAVLAAVDRPFTDIAGYMRRLA